MKAYNDPRWSEGDREMFRAKGLEVTTAEVEAGIPATQCGNCGFVEDEPAPAEEVEDHCDMCGNDGYISTGFLVRRGGVDYFMGRA
jgi:hypothetical protein